MTKQEKIRKQQALRFIMDTYPDKINFHQREIEYFTKGYQAAKAELEELSKVEVE